MKISGETRVLGIIGNPVRHTMSPVIHNYISEELGKNMVYVPFEVTGDVSVAVKGAFELGVMGMNVTVPHKTNVIESLVDIDELAKGIGAVNTLVRTESGYKGYNTDMLGLEREVISEGIELKGQNAVLLGAGGAARAVAFMCAKHEVSKMYILNRTVSKAEEIAASIREYVKDKGTSTEVVTMEIDEYGKICEDNLVVFQCTKIGLSEEDGAVVEDTSFYKKVKNGIDLIYRDGTKFQKLVAENGGNAYTGMKMLMYQAIIAYELWNNLTITDDVIAGVEKVLNNG